FFSSRRRHTRFSRDWSSDVCSSDLGEYCESKHRGLRSTIAPDADLASALLHGPLKIMACHETAVNHELPCVGWLYNQLGPGNNKIGRASCREKDKITKEDI